MPNQYLVHKEDGYLKENGKITNSLERAEIFPTKKKAQEYVDKYGGDVKPVYLSETVPKHYPPPVDEVFMVKKVCNVYGLFVYGPVFTYDEAIDLYNSEFIRGEIFPFREELAYAHNGEIKKSSNKLGDELILCKFTRAKFK
mgnify:CR=1 FL=1